MFILPVSGFKGGNEKFVEIRADSLFHLVVNLILCSWLCHMHSCFSLHNLAVFKQVKSAKKAEKLR